MHDSRSLPRRRVYLGEGLTFELPSGTAEAIDISSGGLGLAGALEGLALCDTVSVRYTGRGASGVTHRAVVRHVGRLRGLSRAGLALVADAPPAHALFPCPDGLPAFAVAACPWFFGESLRFRVLALGAAGMTVSTGAPLPPGAELDFELHLPCVGVERVRGRLTSARDVAWVDPPRALSKALARFLLAGDGALTPAALRTGGLAAGSVDRAVAYDYASTPADHDAILALRLRAHQAEGHLAGATIEDIRSPFDAHARHLTCRFGGRIVGYVRVIFVDRSPARSQYVSLGGHEVPPWLWREGFVEAGAGAMDPDFQRAGLFVGLMQHAYRVAVQSGHRFVLGACEDGLLGMYREMGFERLEQRIVEPKPGWRFRSHLIYADAERLIREPPASRIVAAMASAIEFANARARLRPAAAASA